jgi:nucleotide-binding universal stress UspA family protein
MLTIQGGNMPMTNNEARRTATAVSEGAADTNAANESLTAECVLLGTNGSTEAEAALAVARSYAAREELLLRILTVLEPLPMLPFQPSGVTYAMTVEREQGQRILNRVRAQLTASPVPPHSLTSMLVGSPGATIANAAREWHAQYIFLGAGQHRTLERLLTADTVVRVLRHATSPVIAVPSGRGELPRNGVVGIDFGLASLAAVRCAARFIATGTLHIVHVRPEIDIPATDPDAWSEVYEVGAAALMNKLAGELNREFPEICVETAVSQGHAATVLLDHAARVSADLIAVGQHGHGVVDRFLFGSVAQEIVRSTHCAVLVTPPLRRSE